MKLTGKINRVTPTAGVLLVELAVRPTDGLEKLGDGELSIELKKAVKKRSLDSNSYFWTLVGKMAALLRTDKDDVYLSLLERYGVYVPLVARPEAVARLKKEWRLVREMGTVSVEGETGVQLLCFYGSHGYDQQEMNRLIEGTVAECRELGIETMTDEEIAAMNEAWGQ